MTVEKDQVEEGHLQANGDNAVTVTVNTDPRTTRRRRGRRLCLIITGAILLCFFLLCLLFLVLALTVFKPRTPTIDVLSTTLSGISPRITFPVMKIELNVSLDLRILITNRNRASFRHGTGETALFYRGVQVGEADLLPGEIPAMGSSEHRVRLTLQVDRLAAAADIGALVRDVLAGELAVESRAAVPGRVNFLGVLKKHIVAVAECQFVVGVMDMKIRSQACKQKAKL